MGKYIYLGFFLAIALLMTSMLVVNHGTNTANMQEIDTGVKTAVIGQMRNSDTGADDYGMRAKDTVALITSEVTSNLSKINKIATIDFKLFKDEEGKQPLNYDTAISTNAIVKSVQYRVNIYNTKDVMIDASGQTVIKSDAQAESSTENRIVLNKNI